MLIGGILGASILPILSDKFRKPKVFLVICVRGCARHLWADRETCTPIRRISLALGLRLSSVSWRRAPVVVADVDVGWTVGCPSEGHAPLVVDANRVETAHPALQRLHAVARRIEVPLSAGVVQDV